MRNFGKSGLINLVSLFVVVSCMQGVARADVTCTLRGRRTIEPLDSYFCDNASSDCTGWLEQDLHRARTGDLGPRPLQYLRIDLYQGNKFLLTTHTDANGDWAASVRLPGDTCVDQQVDVRWVFARVHEDDLNASNTRYRFYITSNNADASRYTFNRVRLSGTVTSYDHTTPSSTTSEAARIANVFYTANSTVRELVRWTGRLNQAFASRNLREGGAMRIRYDAANAGVFSTAEDQPRWRVNLGYETYNRGAYLRHEIGHLVHMATHSGRMSLVCNSDNLGSVRGRSDTGCDHGFNALLEGLPSLIGMRTIFDSNTNGNGWWCTCGDNGNQNVCSDSIATALRDNDRIVGCTAGVFSGVADDFATTAANCSRLRRQDGCCDLDTCGACGTAGDCAQSFWQRHGWRNTRQIHRFLWDLLDSTTDGGQDDTDLTMAGANGFIAILENMPCDAGVFGVDGTCNEGARASASQCVESNSATAPPADANGTRDTYNVWDVAWLVPGDQENERVINCVQGVDETP